MRAKARIRSKGAKGVDAEPGKLGLCMRESQREN